MSPRDRYWGPVFFWPILTTCLTPSKAKLDTIVYLTINSQSDAQTLQDDLLKLEQWESDWSMEFNPDKCEVIHVSKKNTLIFPYKLHNTELKSTENTKYLGVTISNDFNWKPHIENMTSKAYNTLKFIKRNIQTNNQKIKETAYNTYVRPQLEYCTPVWHPWQDKLSYKIERVQRAAARYVLNEYGTTSNVTEMLNTLNWQTLESRRIKNSLILLYKTKYQLVVIDHFYLTETRNLNFFVPYSLYHIPGLSTT